MSKRYSLVCRKLRGGIYSYDATTKKRDSLKTKDLAEAERLVAARTMDGSKGSNSAATTSARHFGFRGRRARLWWRFYGNTLNNRRGIIQRQKGPADATNDGIDLVHGGG